MDRAPSPTRRAMARAALSAALAVAWLGFVVVYALVWWDSYSLAQGIVVLLASLVAVSMLRHLVWPEPGSRGWEGWRNHRVAAARPGDAGGAGEGHGSGEGGQAAEAGAAGAAPEPPPRMPPGLRPRVTASILAGLAWAVAVLLHAAFLWPALGLGQNLALLAAGALLLLAALAVVWVPWGLRFAELNEAWRPAEEPRSGAPRSGAPRSGAPRSGAPRSGAPRP